MAETQHLPLAWQIDPACHRAGIGRTKLYELIDSGEIKAIKAGRRTLIPESELQRWIANKLGELDQKSSHG